MEKKLTEKHAHGTIHVWYILFKKDTSYALKPEKNVWLQNYILEELIYVCPKQLNGNPT